MVKKKPLVLGIAIEPKWDFVEHEGRKHLMSVNFDFRIQKGSIANPLFYSSPRLVSILSSKPKFFGKKIGYWHYMNAFSQKGNVVSEMVFPFDSARGAKSALTGKGIARDLQRKCLARLALNTSPRLIVEPSFGVASAKRRKQVRALGVHVDGDKVPAYSVSVGTLLNRANALRRKDRKARRVRVPRP